MQTQIYNNIGNNYEVTNDNKKALQSAKQKDFEKAIEYYNKTIEISKKMENSRYYYLNSINNLGYTIERQGDLDKALEAFKVCRKRILDV